MNYSQIVNHFHKIVVIYISCGWMIESQRKYLLFFLPTIQFQFLINNDMCILTQLENYLLINEYKEDDSKKDDIVNDSFIDKSLKKYNINIEPNIRVKMIHGLLYSFFCINYFLS